MELPNEVVGLVIAKLKLPELRIAHLVSKDWKILAMEEMKKRVKQCLLVNVYAGSAGSRWQSSGTKALVDGNWYDFPADCLWRYTHRSSVTKPITLVLHECLTSVNGCCVYLQLVRFEAEGWNMVVSCNVWKRPLVKPLPCEGLSEDLEDTLNRLVADTYVALWVDERDLSCSSFKVIFTAFNFGQCLAFLFDSNHDQWFAMGLPHAAQEYAVLSPVVKGDFCYALFVSAQGGLSLISCDFRTDRSFQVLADLPWFGLQSVSWYFGSRFVRGFSCLAEFEGQLLLVEKIISIDGAKLVVSKIELHSLCLWILDQFAIPHDWHGCVDVKVVNRKLYINLKMAEDNWKITELSSEGTRDVLYKYFYDGRVSLKLW